jgi:hypothetical protein
MVSMDGNLNIAMNVLKDLSLSYLSKNVYFICNKENVCESKYGFVITFFDTV